jgi:hypothetical protein
MRPVHSDIAQRNALAIVIHLQATLAEGAPTQPKKDVSHLAVIKSEHGHDFERSDPAAKMVAKLNGERSKAERKTPTGNPTEFSAPSRKGRIVELGKPPDVNLEPLPFLLGENAHRGPGVDDGFAYHKRPLLSHNTEQCDELFQI